QRVLRDSQPAIPVLSGRVLRCPHCSKGIQIPDNAITDLFCCSSCKGMFRVAEAPARQPAVAGVAAEPAPPPASLSANTPAGSPTPQRRHFTEEDVVTAIRWKLGIPVDSDRRRAQEVWEQVFVKSVKYKSLLFDASSFLNRALESAVKTQLGLFA